MKEIIILRSKQRHGDAKTMATDLVWTTFLDKMKTEKDMLTRSGL